MVKGGRFRNSPLPHMMARKRRAISIKSGKCRTSARTVTPVNFTVLDATIISSAPNNTNTNYHTNNAMEDFMNPHAVPAPANAATAQRATCTGLVPPMAPVHGTRQGVQGAASAAGNRRLRLHTCPETGQSEIPFPNHYGKPTEASVVRRRSAPRASQPLTRSSGPSSARVRRLQTTSNPRWPRCLCGHGPRKCTPI